MWWANRDTKKVPFSCRNSAGKRDEEDNFSVVPLFLGAKSAPALSHLCNNVLLYNGRIPSMLTLPMSSSALRLREEVSCFSSTVSHQPTALCNERTASFFPSTPFSWYGQQTKFRCLFFILSNFSGFVKCFFRFFSNFFERGNPEKKNRLWNQAVLRIVACLEGFEPPTYWFVASHSIQLSYRHICLTTLFIIAHLFAFVKGFFKKILKKSKKVVDKRKRSW